MLAVKGNQPTLYADLATYFDDPDTVIAPYQQDVTVDRHRGRTKTRSIQVSCGMNDYLAPKWPLVRQVARLTRSVRVHKNRQEDSGGGLPPDRSHPHPASTLDASSTWSGGIGASVRSVSPKRTNSSGMASKEVKSSLTTDRVTWGAIPHPLGERGKAAPSR